VAVSDVQFLIRYNGRRRPSSLICTLPAQLLTGQADDYDGGGSFMGGPQDCRDVGCECGQAGVMSPSTEVCGL